MHVLQNSNCFTAYINHSENFHFTTIQCFVNVDELGAVCSQGLASHSWSLHTSSSDCDAMVQVNKMNFLAYIFYILYMSTTNL